MIGSMSLPTLAPHPPKGAKRPLSPANRPVKDERRHPNYLEDAVKRALQKSALLRKIADYTKDQIIPSHVHVTDKELLDAVNKVLHGGSSSRHKAPRSSSPTSEAPSKRPRTNDHNIISPTNNGMYNFQAMPPAPGTHIPSVAPAPILPENNERITDWYENKEDRLGGLFTGNPSASSEPVLERLPSNGEFVRPALPQSSGFRAVNSLIVPPAMSTTTMETENHYQHSVGSIHSSLMPVTMGGGAGNICEFCAKPLNSPSAKQEHESVHVKELSGYRRYSCPLTQCDYKHIRARDVLMHLRKKHAQPPKEWQLREVQDNGAIPPQEWERLKQEFRDRKENNPIKFVHQETPGNGMPFNGKSRAAASSLNGHPLNTSMAPASHSRTVVSHQGLDTHLTNAPQGVAAPGSNIGELLDLPPTMSDPWDLYAPTTVGVLSGDHQMSSELLEGLGSFSADIMYSSYSTELDVDTGTQSTQPSSSQNYQPWGLTTV